MRIGEGGATARPSSDIPGTTRGLGVKSRRDARRRCSAARGRRSRGSSCAVPGRRRGGARRPLWRACSRRAAAWRRRTRASSAGGSRSLGKHDDIVLAQVCEGFRAETHCDRKQRPPLRIDGEARCSDPCSWAPRVQRAQSEALLLPALGTSASRAEELTTAPERVGRLAEEQPASASSTRSESVIAIVPVVLGRARSSRSRCRGRCGWHLVSRSRTTTVTKSLPKPLFAFSSRSGRCTR